MKKNYEMIILGTFITIALSINAFFLEGIYTKQNEIEIKVAQLLVKEEVKSKAIEELKLADKEILKRLNRVERKIL